MSGSWLSNQRGRAQIWKKKLNRILVDIHSYVHCKAPNETLTLRPLLKTSHSALDLHLGTTVLPNSDIGCNAILAVVEEDDPVKIIRLATVREEYP